MAWVTSRKPFDPQTSWFSSASRPGMVYAGFLNLVMTNKYGRAISKKTLYPSGINCVKASPVAARRFLAGHSQLDGWLSLSQTGHACAIPVPISFCTTMI
jgi:hypothetical protein